MGYIMLGKEMLKINRPLFCFLASLFCAGVQAERLPEKPNIIFILTDDQGIDDLGSHGRDTLETPNLDKLGSESLVFTQWRTHPSCAPTRGSLMTGRYFLRTGTFGVNKGLNHMNLYEVMIPAYLKTAGYRSAIIGKWHLGETDPGMPHNKGFDAAWTQGDVCVNGIHTHYDPLYNHNGELVRKKGWTAELNTDMAIEFVEESSAAQKPFFLYLAYPQPHGPWQAPQAYVQKYQDKGLSIEFATLNGMIDHLDHNIGRLLDYLEKSGVGKNTVLFFSGDNGPIGEAPIYVDGKYQKKRARLTKQESARRSPTGLRGQKGQPWENGVRNNLFVKWPAALMPGTVDVNCHPVDILPTLMELAGKADFQVSKPLDGKSLVPLMRGESIDWENRILIISKAGSPKTVRENGWAVRDDHEAITRERIDCTVHAGKYNLVRNKGDYFFFDLEKDSKQENDIKSKNPERFLQLKSALEAFDRDVIEDPETFSFPTYPIGQPGRDFVFLESVGCPKYKNIKINSVTTDNWKDGSAQILKVEVQTPGVYDVYVNAKGAKPGGMLSVQIGNAVVQGKTQGQSRYKLGTLKLVKTGTAECLIELSGGGGNVLIPSLQTLEIRQERPD